MMTSDEVEMLGASTWLDDLISTKIMAWTKDVVNGVWRDANGFTTRAIALWRPSTSNDDAITVLERIREARGWHWALEWIHPWEKYPCGAWYVWAESWPGVPCEIGDEDRVLEVTAPTVALAICRAAVAVVD